MIGECMNVFKSLFLNEDIGGLFHRDIDKSLHLCQRQERQERKTESMIYTVKEGDLERRL
jgi:hypothetical protein